MSWGVYFSSLQTVSASYGFQLLIQEIVQQQQATNQSVYCLSFPNRKYMRLKIVREIPNFVARNQRSTSFFKRLILRHSLKQFLREVASDPVIISAKKFNHIKYDAFFIMDKQLEEQQFVIQHIHHKLSPVVENHKTGLFTIPHHQHLPHIHIPQNYSPPKTLTLNGAKLALRKINAFNPEYFRVDQRNIIDTLRPGLISYSIPMFFKILAGLMFVHSIRVRKLAFMPVSGLLFCMSPVSQQVINFARESIQDYRRTSLAQKYMQRLGEQRLLQVLDARKLSPLLIPQN